MEFLVESNEIPGEVDVIGVVYDFQDVYKETRGQVHVINVNGENSKASIQENHPEIEERVNRLWEY